MVYVNLNSAHSDIVKHSSNYTNWAGYLTTKSSLFVWEVTG